MSLNVIPLTREIHKNLCGKFNCGNVRLNRFLSGSEALDKGIGVTYVFLTADNSELIGYYNLTTGMITEYDNPANRIGGAIHINCFALDNEYHGLLQGYDKNGNEVKLSDILMMQCLNEINALRNKVGFAFITLSSTKEGRNLYYRAGFEDLDEDMFISEKNIEQDDCAPMYLALDIDD